MKIKRMVAGIAAGMLLLPAAASLNAQEMEEGKTPQHLSLFPTGEANTQYAKYFTGRSYVAMLTCAEGLNCPVANVTFEPGCRNNWHAHSGGQVLIAVGGTGFYQERGKAARRLVPGDVVEIVPGVEHWHGAAPDSWFSHLAIECNPQSNRSTWLEPVGNLEYAAATRMAIACADASGRIARCKENYAALFGGEALTGKGDDPEMMDILQKTIFGEVFAIGKLDARMREMITCTVLATLQTLPQLKAHAAAALRVGVTPVELREAMYQTAPFIGFPRMLNAVSTIDEVFRQQGIALPLAPQGTTSEADRHARGLALQEPLYGDEIRRCISALPGGMGDAVADLLTGYCFGDIYTRGGLDVKTRELLTFCALTAMGDGDALRSHFHGSLRAGCSPEELAAAVVQCLPYIGFPAALKALRIICGQDAQ